MAARRGPRKPPPRKGPTIPPWKARELLTGQVKEARELIARGNVDEDLFGVWNSTTTSIMEGAFGEGHRLVYEVRDVGEIDHILGSDEELPGDHYRQRLEKAIPRIEGAVRQLELGLAPPSDERAAPAGAPVPVVPGNREWDVFISHASEDKDTFVRPLAEALRKKGLRVR